MEAITIIILIVICIILVKWLAGAGEKEKKQKIDDDIRFRQLVASAKSYIENAKIEKQLPVGLTSLMLANGEQALLEEGTQLIETRSVRDTGGGGVRIRVMKGVSVGGFGSQGESHQAYRVIDQGTITLTDKKIIFSGSKENRNIPIDKIIKFDPFNNGMIIKIDGRSKNVAFYINNSFLWGAIINMLHSEINDISNLQPENFDKALEWLKNWESSDVGVSSVSPE
ncbi:MAG: hypothetical protein L7H18_02850 [Candidatus Nealsonbacteria bacterium DGGOD1a]|jgi:hypothetical protein|nr:MAG: hypothetical protein L7H18_02850 [Candidatus Nealsonbacteria bacterium DGGOD1a]